MVFSSTTFLFLFLPFVIIINYLLRNSFRNIFILICSLFFYAWGENVLVLLMMASICVNYLFGMLVDLAQKKEKLFLGKCALFSGISLNLLVLFYYKYAGFIVENLSSAGIDVDFDTSNISLPIGVSFFTFQNISYLVDVFRKEVKGQKNLLHLGLYISLFPQLIAGPIVRYIDVYKEIKERIITSESFIEGIKRFIRGLGKKVIIANNTALIADKIFAISPDDISTPVAWLAIICYTLQIYYDFSGYSDMAIGLGKMLGFNFKENFNYPYISVSIQDFWRRWHISLSTWFRDYLYIPLGGNRKGKYRTYVNLIIVFFITGLWHGASWNFVVWGLFHGFFLLLERNIKLPIPSKLFFLKRIYLLLVVIIGWVFFRIEDFKEAIAFLGKMFSFSEGVDNSPLMYLNFFMWVVMIVGILFSAPLRSLISDRLLLVFKNGSVRRISRRLVYLVLFLFTIMELAQTTYNPFIYFRF